MGKNSKHEATRSMVRGGKTQEIVVFELRQRQKVCDRSGERGRKKKTELGGWGLLARKRSKIRKRGGGKERKKTTPSREGPSEQNDAPGGETKETRKIRRSSLNL